ncbi:MAG: histidine phosphatase family protein, partial [Oscillospiraceae bacterium]|nr:histidine phosphatase family protein [Oscillospiraceae bacterium]
MSRRIHLIRHAMPDIPIGERWCVGGRSDFPLGTLGRLQAALLPFDPALDGVSAVFCSRLVRARETALPLCPAPTAVEGLEEQDMGVWDGLSFRQIRERFPALYAAREQDPSLLPEGAESMEQVSRRMRAGIRRCLDLSTGDIAIVSHKSAIASLTGRREALGYTSVSVLCAEGGELRVESVGRRPHPLLADRVCEALLRSAG